MKKIFSENELLCKVEEALDYDNQELGLKPTYWIGNNDCDGMDTSSRPNMPLMQY